MKRLDIALWIIGIFLGVVGGVSIIEFFLNPEFRGILLLSGFSTFVIALLTIIYVYTTNRQLNIMSKQLEEMKQDHELRIQPLPWVNQIKFYIEKPKLYYNMPELKIYFGPRYECRLTLKNVGNSPAVSTDLICHLLVPTAQEDVVFEAASVNISVLEEKTTSNEIGFLFVSDSNGILLRSLLESDVFKLPRLKLTILYKNVLGGMFQLTSYYLIYPPENINKNEYKEIIKDWIAQIATFPVKFKEEIEYIEDLLKTNYDLADLEFNTLKNEIEKIVSGEDLELTLWQLPGMLDIRNLNTLEYWEKVRNLGYGFKIDNRFKCPMLEKKKSEES